MHRLVVPVCRRGRSGDAHLTAVCLARRVVDRETAQKQMRLHQKLRCTLDGDGRKHIWPDEVRRREREELKATQRGRALRNASGGVKALKPRVPSAAQILGTNSVTRETRTKSADARQYLEVRDRHDVSDIKRILRLKVDKDIPSELLR